VAFRYIDRIFEVLDKVPDGNSDGGRELFNAFKCLMDPLNLAVPAQAFGTLTEGI
jgi:hypothetical protein